MHTKRELRTKLSLSSTTSSSHSSSFLQLLPVFTLHVKRKPWVPSWSFLQLLSIHFQLLPVYPMHSKLKPWAPNLSFLLSVYLQLLPIHTAHAKPKSWAPTLSFLQLLSIHICNFFQSTPYQAKVLSTKLTFSSTSSQVQPQHKQNL